MKHSWKRNSSSSTLFIALHWYIPLFTLSNRKKLQFPLQNEIVPLTSKHLQNFPGEKALSSYHFRIFKLQLLSASFSSPDASSFSFFNASYSDLLSLCDHETLGNWSVFGITPLQLQTSSSIRLVSVIPPPNGLVFLLVVADWPVAWKLPAFNLRAWFKQQLLSINHHSTRKWPSEPHPGLAIFYGCQREKQVDSQKEASSGAQRNSQPQRRVGLKSQPSERGWDRPQIGRRTVLVSDIRRL